jgi:hypothetical protein
MAGLAPAIHVDPRVKPGDDEKGVGETKGNSIRQGDHELRVYHCVPGRLPDLLKRFDTITLNIWKKYGIEQAGFWTVLVGESNQALYYLLKFDSLADREKKWNAFQADPEWHAARAKTEENGPIVAKVVNSFLQPTSFSSVK